jgi:cytochrome c oxidase accessory protein FixG
MHTDKENNEPDSFRDSISTIGKDGKRAWIFPKKPKGRFYRARTYVSFFFLIILFGLPFIKKDGFPFVLLNFIERKFILFGIPFWPQDFFLFVLAMLTFIMFIILFTVIFGRVWCGWACPQTIFMEMVFRKIEYWIEGDYIQQKQLAAAEWNSEKTMKRALKYFIFFILSFLIANTFLAYIISYDQLKHLATEGPFNHPGGFIAIIVFTFVFFLVYTRFREQACIVVCPYGRLQGVLLDRDSLVVAYDRKRGDPKGKIHKNEDRTIGDCIDCHQCVNVCPTGIDIRNGTQMECVNCTACMDACDEIMDHVGFKRGLVRITSENMIERKTKFRFTPRIIGYSVVLFILLSTVTTLLAFRSEVESTILRTPGMLYQKFDNNKIGNLYNIQVVNKTFKQFPVQLRLKSPAGEIKYIGNGLTLLEKQSLSEAEFFVILSGDKIKSVKTPLIIEIISNGKVIEEVKTNFMGPVYN